MACPKSASCLYASFYKNNIFKVNLICCPEGIQAINKAYPKVKIVTAAIDGGLNEKKFITPGTTIRYHQYYGKDWVISGVGILVQIDKLL